MFTKDLAHACLNIVTLGDKCAQLCGSIDVKGYQ